MPLTPAIIKSWPKPNYADPVTLAVPIHVVNSIGIVFMSIILVSRLVARTKIVRKPLGADDWTMLVAYVRSRPSTRQF